MYDENTQNIFIEGNDGYQKAKNYMNNYAFTFKKN